MKFPSSRSIHSCLLVVAIVIMATYLPSAMIASESIPASFAQDTVHAQQTSITPLIDSLTAIRTGINKTGMLTLGAWALGNIAVNGALMLGAGNGAERGSAYYFQQMNVFWNVVNLALAGFGYYGASTESLQGLSLFDAVSKQASIEKTLLLNAGLDLAYCAAGAWMLERSKTDTERTALWQGYGQSLLLQGAFLFVFDVSLVVIHTTATEPLLKNVLESVQLGMGRVGVRLRL
jgi:hypothetical protein